MNNQLLSGHLNDLPRLDNGAFVEGSEKSIVFGPDRFWPDNVMRCFYIPGGGVGNMHSHPWPHYIFVYQGEGSFTIDDVCYPVKSGSWVYVPDDAVHGFKNGSDTDHLVFLCNVPPRGYVNPLQNDDQPEQAVCKLLPVFQAADIDSYAQISIESEHFSVDSRLVFYVKD